MLLFLEFFASQNHLGQQYSEGDFPIFLKSLLWLRLGTLSRSRSRCPSWRWLRSPWPSRGGGGGTGRVREGAGGGGGEAGRMPGGRLAARRRRAGPGLVWRRGLRGPGPALAPCGSGRRGGGDERSAPLSHADTRPHSPCTRLW